MRKTKKKFDAFKDYDESLPPAPAKATARQSAKPSDKETAAQLMEQYRVVVKAEAASFRERVKFGAMLILWEQYLGGSGQGREGEGLKGWLAEHCPAISYVSAMAYKDSAKRAVAMLGGGAMGTAALLGETEVVTPAGETVEVAAEILERRDAIFEDATSRRKLEQMYFDFMGKEEKAATRKARKEKDGVSAHKEVAKAKLAAANGKVLSAADSAAILWGDAMAVFETNRGAFFSAARDLNVNLAEGWLEELKMLVDALKKRVAQR